MTSAPVHQQSPLIGYVRQPSCAAETSVEGCAVCCWGCLVSTLLHQPAQQPFRGDCQQHSALPQSLSCFMSGQSGAKHVDLKGQRYLIDVMLALKSPLA